MAASSAESRAASLSTAVKGGAESGAGLAAAPGATATDGALGGTGGAISGRTAGAGCCVAQDARSSAETSAVRRCMAFPVKGPKFKLQHGMRRCNHDVQSV